MCFECYTPFISERRSIRLKLKHWALFVLKSPTHCLRPYVLYRMIERLPWPLSNLVRVVCSASESESGNALRVGVGMLS
jgi:hypothetical protein